ncbi:hypothetical protein EDD85DRAFT_962904 [Armillaria nabsnona]|nr:hypothetical protein EDD85DRAFT_962904 [Armillaria nabsnona]
MRFSVAALIPLAALAVPALSDSVQSRDDLYGGVDYKGKDHHNVGGSKDYNYGNKNHGRKDCTWELGKYTPYDHKEVDKITFEIECKSFREKDDKCNSCQVYSKDKFDDKFVCELFVEIIDIETWEEDCDDDKDRKDGKGRKDGKKDDKGNRDDHKYYDTSCWNAHYNY